jgi:hypothetical protein
MNIMSDEAMRELPLIKMYTAKGREEGSLIARRADILKVLRSRLKLAQTEEFVSPLERIEEPDRLDHLLDVAATCTTIEEFRAAL